MDSFFVDGIVQECMEAILETDPSFSLDSFGDDEFLDGGGGSGDVDFFGQNQDISVETPLTPTRLGGIGNKKIDKLKAFGITTVEFLAFLDTSETIVNQAFAVKVTQNCRKDGALNTLRRWQDKAIKYLEQVSAQAKRNRASASGFVTPLEFPNPVVRDGQAHNFDAETPRKKRMKRTSPFT